MKKLNKYQFLILFSIMVILPFQTILGQYPRGNNLFSRIENVLLSGNYFPPTDFQFWRTIDLNEAEKQWVNQFASNRQIITFQYKSEPQFVIKDSILKDSIFYQIIPVDSLQWQNRLSTDVIENRQKLDEKFKAAVSTTFAPKSDGSKWGKKIYDYQLADQDISINGIESGLWWGTFKEIEITKSNIDVFLIPTSQIPSRGNHSKLNYHDLLKKCTDSILDCQRDLILVEKYDLNGKIIFVGPSPLIQQNVKGDCKNNSDFLVISGKSKAFIPHQIFINGDFITSQQFSIKEDSFLINIPNNHNLDSEIELLFIDKLGRKITKNGVIADTGFCPRAIFKFDPNCDAQVQKLEVKLSYENFNPDSIKIQLPEKSPIYHSPPKSSYNFEIPSDAYIDEIPKEINISLSSSKANIDTSFTIPDLLFQFSEEFEKCEIDKKSEIIDCFPECDQAPESSSFFNCIGRYYSAIIIVNDGEESDSSNYIEGAWNLGNDLSEILLNNFQFDSADTKLLRNIGSEDFLKIILELRKLPPTQQILFYYIGHGDQNGNLRLPDGLPFEKQFVLDNFENLPSENLLAIFEICFGTQHLRENVLQGSGNPPKMDFSESCEFLGKKYIFSSGSNPAYNLQFSKAFVRRLKTIFDDEKFISIDHILGSIREYGISYEYLDIQKETGKKNQQKLANFFFINKKYFNTP